MPHPDATLAADSGTSADDDAAEPACLEWAPSPGTEWNEGSPEDLRCVRWGS